MHSHNSFILAISIAPLQFHYYRPTQRRSRLQHGYCIGVSRRSAEATVSKGLAQGRYVVARAGVKPTTLRLRVIDLTNAPPRPSNFKLSSLTGYGHASAVPRCLEEWCIGNQISALSFDMTASNICHQAGACALLSPQRDGTNSRSCI